MYQINDRVVLKSFLGIKKPESGNRDNENYSLLIGKYGAILDLNKREKKILILFDDNLDDLNLINHNKIKNSLWIYESDIKKIV